MAPGKTDRSRLARLKKGRSTTETQRHREEPLAMAALTLAALAFASFLLVLALGNDPKLEASGARPPAE